MAIVPYYEEDNIVVYCGDCLEVLPQLEPVDMILTDPPYDSMTHDGVEFFDHLDFAPMENVESLVKLLLSKSKTWTICFCALEMLGDYKKAAPDCWIRGGIWDRVSNMPQISGDRPAQGGEGIAIFHGKGRKKWNGGGKAAIWRHAVERNKKEHPTQKPLSLFHQLVEQFSFDNQTILDPFMGSGTTLRAAKDLGRKAIGIELNERYCEIAVKKLGQRVLSF